MSPPGEGVRVRERSGATEGRLGASLSFIDFNDISEVSMGTKGESFPKKTVSIFGVKLFQLFFPTPESCTPVECGTVLSVQFDCCET